MSKSSFIIIEDNLKTEIDIGDGRKLFLTKHAERRIRQREISIAHIKETFCNPDITMPNSDWENARNYFKSFEDQKLKLGIKDKDEPFVLITAFYV
jgi:hypothetical protein